MDPRYLLAAFVVLGLAFVAYARRPETSSEDARALVADGAVLVDVRTPEEFAAGHLPGAINLPVQELTGRVRELGPTGTGLVVYCRSGARSAHATRLLRAAGYTDVHDLGAMSRW